MSAYQSTCQILANAARIGVALGGLTPDDALDHAARGAVENATKARTRTGHWASESTSEQIEAALWTGTVARDILDGTVERPSVGNVRAYALSLI